MNNRSVFFNLFFIFLFHLAAGQQDTVSLRQCMIAVRDHAIVNEQIDVLYRLADLKRANVKASNLPAVSAYGKASYQSDAVSISMPGGIGIDIDPFQYNTGVEAIQKLYDGGMAGKLNALEESVLTAETEKINMEVYTLTSQVVDLFFRIRLLENAGALLTLKEEILTERSQEMQLALDNGILKKNDMDAMEAELLSVKQQIIEMSNKRHQLLASLSVLTQMDFSENVTISREDSLFQNEACPRPETIYFEAERQKLESLAALQKTKNLPRIYAFGQAGYSYPGLNFYENQSDFYYIVGARLSWTLFDWNQNKREIEMLRTQKETLVIRESEFEQQIDMALQREAINQEELKRMIALDDQIIARRASVTRGSATSLDEGVITSTDYLEDLNMEIKARMEAEYHMIEWQRSRVQQEILEGIDISAL